MLRRLTLRNWRNYEDLTVEFSPGTTFVVASNGVGKTSLVEAARWALFGTKAPGEAAVRKGHSEAYAGVELELPDRRLLTVERTLHASRRARPPQAVVQLDGAAVPTEQLEQLLLSAYQAESWFLAGATMPAADRHLDTPSALRLREHLGRYYGVDNLNNALDQLKAMLKDTESRIKGIKQANAASAKALAELQEAMQQSARRAETASNEHAALQQRVERARDYQRARAQLGQWQETHNAWLQTARQMSTELSELLGQQVTPDTLEGMLDQSLAELSSQLDTVRVEIGVKQANEQSLLANEQRLDAAHDDCPVCRRPLDDSTVAFAHEANARELTSLRDSVNELRDQEADLLARRQTLQRWQAQWRSAHRPGPAPHIEPVEDDWVDPDEILALAEAALNVRVEARAANVAATNQYNDALAADQAMRELESLFQQSARLSVAIDTTESTVRELIEANVRPLTVEVNQRWKALFPNRGDITTYSDGEITRTVNGSPLPFDSFSTGEGMGATILLRLLVTQMATGADFCWFDEPLEHLDPDVRRKVASLLTRVTSGGYPLRQVVVTTYEEPLARHLKTRDEQWVTLLDVRQTGQRDSTTGRPGELSRSQ
jgi:DNA repair exonuclease SbcCD ATPase subunit